MKKCVNLLAMLALFGFVMPVMAAPQEVAVDDRPIVGGEVDPEDVVALEEEESGWTLGGSVGVDFCSKQLTYGLVDNPHGIVTPSAELSFGHDDYFTLAVGVEAIFDTTNYGAKDGGYNDRRWKYQEFDPYIALSRSWELGEDVALYTEVGYLYEYHPRACHKPSLEYSNPDTQWLTFVIGLEENILNPTLEVEYQLVRQGPEAINDGQGAIYATFSFSHEFDIGEKLGLDEGSLCLTPTLGIAMANKERNLADFSSIGEEDEDYIVDDHAMFRDAFASLELAYTPIEGLSIAPYVGCHQQIDDEARKSAGDDKFVAYFGIGVSYEF